MLHTDGYIDVEITPLITSSYLSGNFSSICNSSLLTSRQFYVVRASTNTSQAQTFMPGDIVYTTWSSGNSPSNAFGGHIVILIAPTERTVVRVVGSIAGEVDNPATMVVDCSGGP